ncbi:MAG: basic secretory protein-like protein [Prolixibacteraceae bacterium]|jgi:hypothetical protein
MKRILNLVIVLLFGSASLTYAQDFWHEKDVKYYSKDSISKKGFTLIFVSRDSTFSKTTSEQLKQTFFKVYPELASQYNKYTAKKVEFIIEPRYDGVAATTGNIVVFNPQWFRKNPNDIDVVTHEVMHIVQGYGDNAGPGWLTEGIADYVRNKYGVANPEANWTMPEWNPKQSYTDAYRVTARFLTWAEKRHNKKLVKKLDTAMRNHTYSDQMWKNLTGKTVDELWKEYESNPTL